jgi:hypothetical protein
VELFVCLIHALGIAGKTSSFYRKLNAEPNHSRYSIWYSVYKVLEHVRINQILHMGLIGYLSKYFHELRRIPSSIFEPK